MDLRPHDELHLTCVRGGGCCHAQFIPVTPWEIALLARGMGLPPARFRDLHTADGGTRLRPSGAPDAQGRQACPLLAEGGCSQHAARPLACRLFPLGRRLNDGHPIYHLTSAPHPCAALCPAYAAQPPVRVADWLAGQGVAAGEAAHDAYGRLVSGLLLQAGSLAEGDVDFAPELTRLAASAPTARAAGLPAGWYDLVTAPALAGRVDDPVGFVADHGQALLDALPEDAPAAARLLMAVALHLAVPLGVPSASAVRLAVRM